jgi:ribosomal protein S18 acetylase RimI-like enzyme
MLKSDIFYIADLRLKTRSEEDTFISKFGYGFSKDFVRNIFYAEKDACFIIEENGEICAYLLGTTNYSKLNIKMVIIFALLFPINFMIGKYKFNGSCNELFSMIKYHCHDTKERHEKRRKEYKAELVEIGVLSSMTRKGYGTILLDAYKGFLKEKCIDRFSLMVYKKDKGAVLFYKKNGGVELCSNETKLGEISTIEFLLKNSS